MFALCRQKALLAHWRRHKPDFSERCVTWTNVNMVALTVLWKCATIQTTEYLFSFMCSPHWSTACPQTAALMWARAHTHTTTGHNWCSVPQSTQKEPSVPHNSQEKSLLSNLLSYSVSFLFFSLACCVSCDKIHSITHYTLSHQLSEALKCKWLKLKYRSQNWKCLFSTCIIYGRIYIFVLVWNWQNNLFHYV